MPYRSSQDGGELGQDASSGDAYKDQLVQQVKSFQRQGQEQKDLWHTYCDTRLGGVRDPFRHDASALQEFVASNGIAPSPVSAGLASCLPKAPGLPLAGLSFGGQDALKESMVQQVKAYQRSGKAQTDTWQNYADVHLGGSRDPSRHDALVLRQFLKLHGAADSGDSQKEQLVQQVKNYQRKGETEKQLWHEYADTQLGGVRDPARHDASTLQTFAQRYELTPAAPDPVARNRLAPSRAPDVRKDELVQQVKAYQRSGQEQKDAWHSYADMQLGGIRDPARHEAQVLQDFIMTHDVPPPSEPATKRMKDSSGAPLGTAMEDPVKHALVLQIKTFQRSNPQQKEMWHEYADAHLEGIRDPARHDVSSLQEFIDLHAVPAVTVAPKAGAVTDPLKDQLIAQVKAFQSANQQQKELWHSYADTHLGGTRDPARHDAAALQHFFSAVSV